MKVNVVSYGAIGAQFFSLYRVEIAEAITGFGRFTIKTARNTVLETCNAKEELLSLSMTDTDSCYFSCKNLVEMKCSDKSNDEIVEFLDKFDLKVLQPIFERVSLKNQGLVNAEVCRMNFDREKIIQSQIISGKKKNASLVLDDEGKKYPDGKIAITGLEIKRSDTPHIMREKLGDILDILFRGSNEDLIEYLKVIENEYKSGKYSLEDIAIPKGVSNIKRYEGKIKGIPMHVRASQQHNRIVKEKSLVGYQEIVNGDKIKLLHLKLPNPCYTDVVAFDDAEFLRETGLDAYIDYEHMYQKTLLNTTEKLIDMVGWKFKIREELESLF